MLAGGGVVDAPIPQRACRGGGPASQSASQPGSRLSQALAPHRAADSGTCSPPCAMPAGTGDHRRAPQPQTLPQGSRCRQGYAPPPTPNTHTRQKPAPLHTGDRRRWVGHALCVPSCKTRLYWTRPDRRLPPRLTDVHVIGAVGGGVAATAVKGLAFIHVGVPAAGVGGEGERGVGGRRVCVVVVGGCSPQVGIPAAGRAAGRGYNWMVARWSTASLPASLHQQAPHQHLSGSLPCGND